MPDDPPRFSGTLSERKSFSQAIGHIGLSSRASLLSRLFSCPWYTNYYSCNGSCPSKAPDLPRPYEGSPFQSIHDFGLLVVYVHIWGLACSARSYKRERCYYACTLAVTPTLTKF